MPGPFLFAWVDVSETAFGPEHQVEDEDVFSFRLEHAEGEFANLTVEIRNPRIGLLSPGRKRWAWLSWNNGSEVIPLFFGRLVGVPGNLQQEIVTLQFTARPADYDACKQLLAETLKVSPYYDPVWIAADKRDDPDVVLEARSQLWHIDRVSHAVTVSDLLVGEDGLLEFPESTVLYDSVEIALEQSPLRRVTVNAEINWTQSATGQVPLQSAYIATATGEDLAGNWFKPDASLGGGWSVASASVADVSGVSAVAADKYEKAAVLPESVGFEFAHVSDQHNVQPWVVPKDWLFYETVNWTFLTAYLHEGVILPRWLLKTELTGKFDVGRQRRERISLTLQSDVQPIVTLPDDNEALVLTLNSEDVGVAIDGEAPIGDVARSSYIVTDRGRQSLEYLIALARAHLLMRSRAVKISFSVPFALAVGLSCRKNALIRDPRLPGGQAVGKVTSYRLSANGDSGELAATITIGCAVGYGGAVADASGEPAYVADDYVDGDYQFYANRLVALPSSDVAYTPPADAVVDDGLNFVSGIRQRDVVVATSVENDWASQLDTALGYLTSQSFVLEAATETITKSRVEGLKKAMDASPTVINLTLKPVEGGPFVALYNVETSALVIPAQINLEAAAA